MIALKNPSAKFFTGQIACITFDNIEKFCFATNFLDLNLAEFYFLFPKSAKKKVFFSFYDNHLKNVIKVSYCI